MVAHLRGHQHCQCYLTVRIGSHLRALTLPRIDERIARLPATSHAAPASYQSARSSVG